MWAAKIFFVVVGLAPPKGAETHDPNSLICFKTFKTKKLQHGKMGRSREGLPA